MEKKEVMVMNLNQKVEEMEGARRATGISSTVTPRGYRGIPVVPDTERFPRKQPVGVSRQNINTVSSGRPMPARSKGKLALFCAGKVCIIPI